MNINIGEWFNKIWRLSYLAVLVVILQACASNEISEIPLTEADADRLYNEGLALSAGGDTKGALEKYQKVDQVAPYSDMARRSLIQQAYLSYSRGQYEDSIRSSKRFITLYPGHKDAAYAQYIIGQSYYDQIPNIARDQQATQDAMQAMSELIRRYPDSEYVTDAKKKLIISQDQLAGKEMDVGRYYQGRRNHLGAINRFKNVVSQYQQTRHIEEALSRLTESYLSLGLVEEAQTAAAVLGHNFPESRWYKKSHNLLKKGGYGPLENKSSWISKTFTGFTKWL